MLNFGISKRLVAALQAFISLGLIILAFGFSLTPLFNIDTTADGFGESGGELREVMAESVSEYSGKELSAVDIEGEIGVSPIRLIKALVLYGKVIKRNISYTSELAAEIDEWISTESGMKDIIIVSALSEIMGEMGKRAGGNESGLSIIFNIVFAFLSFICVLIMTLVLPLILLIKMISAIISAISHRTEPEKISGKLGSSLTSFVTAVLLYAALQCLCGAFTFGFGMVVIIGLAVASAVINGLAARQIELESGKITYLNAVQGASLLSVVGFMIFFFNIISAGALVAFGSGGFSKYTTHVSSIESNDPSATVHGEYMIDGIMMLVYVLLVAVSVYYLERAVRRLSLGGARSEHNIPLAAVALISCVIPLIISGMMHFYENPESAATVGDGSFLPRESFGFGSMIAALIGASLMLLGDVGSVVLVRAFAGSVSSEDRKYLLSGKAMSEFMVGSKENAASLEQSTEEETDETENPDARA